MDGYVLDDSGECILRGDCPTETPTTTAGIFEDILILTQNMFNCYGYNKFMHNIWFDHIYTVFQIYMNI